MFYTYIWYDRDNVAFYVGKGSAKRMLDMRGRNKAFLRKIEEGGCRVAVDDAFIHESQALAREMHLIASFGRKDEGEGHLVNRTDGGESPLDRETHGRLIKAGLEEKLQTAIAEYKRLDMRDDNEDLRMLRIERVLDLIPVSKVHIYRMIKAGEFPAPIKLHGVSLWDNREIREWKERRLAGPRMLVETVMARKRKREREDLA